LLFHKPILRHEPGPGSLYSKEAKHERNEISTTQISADKISIASRQPTLFEPLDEVFT
jgi:hypothetical protein